MIRSHFTRLLALLLLTIGVSSPLSAQAVEVYVFAGGYDDGNRPFDEFDAKIRGGGTWGFKVGGFVSPNFELGGNVSWYNHFGLADPKNVTIFRPVTSLVSPKVSSMLFEGDMTWNFGETRVASRFSPYITLGLGGMSARIKDADEVFVIGGGFVQLPNSQIIVANPGRQIVMEDGDVFLTFSYGGGFKALSLLGPVGFRMDFRGRTIPNYYSQTVTKPEITGGLTFSWGER